MDKEDPEKASPKSPIVINLCAILTCAILVIIVFIAVAISTDSMNGTGKIRFW